MLEMITMSLKQKNLIKILLVEEIKVAEQGVIKKDKMIITPSLTNFNKNLVEAVGIEEVINQDLMKSNPHQMNRIREIVVVEETEVHNVEKEGHVVVIIFNAMTKKTHIVVEVEAVTISEMKIEKTLKRSVKVRKKKIRIHGFINSTIKNVQNMTRLM